MRAIVLAAGVGRRFGAATKRTPKCLLPVAGSNLLSRYLDSFRAVGIRDVVIVVGHRRDLIRKECAKKGAGLRIRFIVNRAYRKGSVLSLYTASRELNSDVLIMDADVYFPVQALKKLLKSDKKSAFLIDPRSKSSGEEMMLMAKRGRPVLIAKKTDPSLRILGEATGILKLSRPDAKKLKMILADFVKAKNVNVEYEDSYSRLMRERRLGTVSIEGFWSEMDFEEDRRKIENAIAASSGKAPIPRGRRPSR